MILTFENMSFRNNLVKSEEASGNKESLTAAFSAFDADKDGLISPNDLR